MTRKELLVLAFAAIVLVAASVLTTVYIVNNNEAKARARAESTDTSRKAIGMTEATGRCKQRILAKLGKRALTITFNDLSNRYDEQKRAYLIFAVVDLEVAGSDGPQPHFVDCIVSASTGSIVRFTVEDPEGREI